MNEPFYIIVHVMYNVNSPIHTSSGSVPSCLALNPTIENTTILENIEVAELVKHTISVSTNELLEGLEYEDRATMAPNDKPREKNI